MERIVLTVAGTSLTCQTRPDLFSPKALDKGSELLMYQLAERQFKTALDWGCGWGAIGLWLAQHRSDSQVTLIDSDLSAIKATQTNAETNLLENVIILPSPGFEALPNDQIFDLIVSNPPTHRGRQVVEDMISDSRPHLAVGGVLLIVVEARLTPWVKRAMGESFGNVEILVRSQKHTVLVGIRSA